MLPWNSSQGAQTCNSFLEQKKKTSCTSNMSRVTAKAVTYLVKDFPKERMRCNFAKKCVEDHEILSSFLGF